MDRVFLLKHNNKYLTVLDCTEDFVALADPNESNAQMWIKDEQGCIKWAEKPHKFLVIDNGQLKLTSNVADKHKWTMTDACLRLQNNLSTCLVQGQNGQVLSSPNGKDKELKWQVIEAHLPRPATSCHLRYGPELPVWLQDQTEWALECSVKVEYSADCTYFCVTGWGPGGYCGIQQLPNNQRKAIFSMWNEKAFSVEAIEIGQGVEASKFGGEGTGIKTITNAPWQEGELITFKVKAYLRDHFWYCQCHFALKEKGPFHLMALLRRSAKGGPILSRQGFYSFIEDFDRGKSARGWKRLRKAQFLQPKLTRPSDGLKVTFTEALFTKVESGSDAFAADFAKATPCKNGFVLQSGIEDSCPNNTTLHSF